MKKVLVRPALAPLVAAARLTKVKIFILEKEKKMQLLIFLFYNAIVVSSSDSCVSVAKKYGISLNEFYNMNPKVHRGSCDNLDDGKSYCVAKGGSSSSGKSKKKSSDVSSKVNNLVSKTKSGKKSSGKKSSSSGSAEKRKKIQTKAAFTYYWIAQAEDNPGGKKVPIKTCAGKTIAKVNENYADALVMEGTGVVDNKIVNLGGCSCSNYKCFEEINRSEEPYGITGMFIFILLNHMYILLVLLLTVYHSKFEISGKNYF